MLKSGIMTACRVMSHQRICCHVPVLGPDSAGAALLCQPMLPILAHCGQHAPGEFRSLILPPPAGVLSTAGGQGAGRQPGRTGAEHRPGMGGAWGHEVRTCQGCGSLWGWVRMQGRAMLVPRLVFIRSYHTAKLPCLPCWLPHELGSQQGSLESSPLSLRSVHPNSVSPPACLCHPHKHMPPRCLLPPLLAAQVPGAGGAAGGRAAALCPSPGSLGRLCGAHLPAARPLVAVLERPAARAAAGWWPGCRRRRRWRMGGAGASGCSGGGGSRGAAS